MDGNAYQSYSSPVEANDLANNVNETMPPPAPSYRYSSHPIEENHYPAYYSEEQTVNRLMDSVHQGRLENVRIGQENVEIRLEDVQIVHGELEIRARIIPKPDVYLENNHYPGYLNPVSNYRGPNFSYTNNYPSQLAYQSPYQQLYQTQYPNQYQPQYQVPYQPQYPYQYQVPYQTQYPYSNQVVPPQYMPQYAYNYPYLNRVSNPYLYQYPMANAAGSIASAISQLALFTMLRR